MADMQSLIERLEKAVARLEGAVPNGAVVPPSSRDISVPGIGEASSAITPSVSEFDSLIDSAVRRVLAPAQKIGGQVLEGSKILEQAFLAERSIVLAISKCKKPDMNGLQKLVQPLAEVIQKASRLTEGKRTDAFNHLKVIAESLTALTWVVFTEKGCGMSFPATHVEEAWQAAEYYNNKVLVEYRNKDADHTEWARAMKELFVPTLRDYTKKFHVTGPNWNIQGVEVSDYSSGGVAVTPSARATAPPPPPPRGNPPPPPAAPPMLSHSPSDSKPSGSQPSMNAVFQEINRGEGITSGLRKVTADMKSKNRTEKSGVVAASDSKSERSIAPTKVKQASPKFELEMDRKWVIENQIGNKSLVISKCNAWQSVYIFGCKDSVIQINGKVNNITMDKCTKTGIVFKDVVAACEMVNCISVEVQCQGSVPSIMIDNTTGCQLYLSKSSLSASITSARSSEINVLVPGLTDEADLVEHALPEQFFHVFNNGSFVTTPVKHTSG